MNMNRLLPVSALCCCTCIQSAVGVSSSGTVGTAPSGTVVPTPQAICEHAAHLGDSKALGPIEPIKRQLMVTDCIHTLAREDLTDLAECLLDKDNAKDALECSAPRVVADLLNVGEWPQGVSFPAGLGPRETCEHVIRLVNEENKYEVDITDTYLEQCISDMSFLVVRHGKDIYLDLATCLVDLDTYEGAEDCFLQQRVE